MAESGNTSSLSENHSRDVRMRRVPSVESKSFFPLLTEKACRMSERYNCDDAIVLVLKSNTYSTPSQSMRDIHSRLVPLPPPNWKEEYFFSGNLNPSVDTSTFQYWHFNFNLLKESIRVSPKASIQTTRAQQSLCLKRIRLRIPSSSKSICPQTSTLLKALTLRKWKVLWEEGFRVWRRRSLVEWGGTVRQAILTMLPMCSPGMSQVKRCSCLSLELQLQSLMLVRVVSLPKQASLEKFLPPTATKLSSWMTAKAQMYFLCTYFHWWSLELRFTQQRMVSFPKINSSWYLSTGQGIATFYQQIASNFIILCTDGFPKARQRTQSLITTYTQVSSPSSQRNRFRIFWVNSTLVSFHSPPPRCPFPDTCKRFSSCICSRNRFPSSSSSDSLSMIFSSDLFLLRNLLLSPSRLPTKVCFTNPFFPLFYAPLPSLALLSTSFSLFRISYSPLPFFSLSPPCFWGTFSSTSGTWCQELWRRRREWTCGICPYAMILERTKVYTSEWVVKVVSWQFWSGSLSSRRKELLGQGWMEIRLGRPCKQCRISFRRSWSVSILTCIYKGLYRWLILFIKQYLSRLPLLMDSEIVSPSP